MSATLDHPFKVMELLWHFDPSTHSDKIWGVVEIDGSFYNFWGRRADLSSASNGKLSFKRLHGTSASHDIAERAREKERQGYQKIDCSRTAEGTYPELERLRTGFMQAFSHSLLLARIGGTIRPATSNVAS